MFNLIVEVFHALRDFLLVDGVVDVEVMQIRISLIGLFVLVQLGSARYRASVSTYTWKIFTTISN